MRRETFHLRNSNNPDHLWEQRQADQNAGIVKCPRCRGDEWFPGAACWDCGWEAPPEQEREEKT